MKNKYIVTSKGFTIVELMISTAVFSFILIAVSITVVEISRLYYKGTILTRTQDTARNLMDSVSRPIQLEGADVVGASGVGAGIVTATRNWPDASGAAGGETITAQSICIGSTRYTFTLNRQVKVNVEDEVDHIRHAMWQDTVSSPAVCADNANMPNLTLDEPNVNGTPTIDGRDVLTEGMRLTNFEVKSDDGKLYTVAITVMYGDRDLMSPVSTDPNVIPTSCVSQLAGSQWCAQASYQTTVMKRISGGI